MGSKCCPHFSPLTVESFLKENGQSANQPQLFPLRRLSTSTCPTTEPLSLLGALLILRLSVMFSTAGLGRLIIHSPPLQIQHGGTVGPPLWLFCASTFLSIPCQLPPRLLASTRASYVRPVYTTSSLFLFICLPPLQPDTLLSDKAIYVLIGGLRWYTLPRPVGNHGDLLFEAMTRQPDRRLKWKRNRHKCVISYRQQAKQSLKHIQWLQQQQQHHHNVKALIWLKSCTAQDWNNWTAINYKLGFKRRIPCPICSWKRAGILMTLIPGNSVCRGFLKLSKR